jgi:hypothetical protein
MYDSVRVVVVASLTLYLPAHDAVHTPTYTQSAHSALASVASKGVGLLEMVRACLRVTRVHTLLRSMCTCYARVCAGVWKRSQTSMTTTAMMMTTH